MARGNRRAPIFHDDDDRNNWLAVLETMTARYGTRCCVYCLMTNHYHLVVQTPRGNISDAIRYLNGVYSQQYNRRHGVTGHVFEGRFASIVVNRPEYLRTLARYVVRNPVRAGLVASPSDWKWSSYKATSGLMRPPTFLDIGWIRGLFDGTQRQAQRMFQAFVNTPDDKTAAIDERVWDDSLDGVPPPAQQPANRPKLEEIFSGTVRTKSARDALICRAHYEYAYPLSEISLFLGLRRGSASAAVRRLESRKSIIVT